MVKSIDSNLKLLQSEINDLNDLIADENNDLSHNELDLTINKNTDVLLFLILRLADRENLSIWYKIAFAIVVRFIRKLIDDKG